MKKFLSLLTILLCIPTLCSCQYAVLGVMALFMGTHYADDPAEYGKYASHIQEQLDFFPESIEEYEVENYAYTSYEYLGSCYEVYLELTVEEEQLSKLLADAREGGPLLEREAYYAEGYYEIVFYDHYVATVGATGIENVGWATIDKVVYNPQTRTIIFESFHAHDTNVYALKDVVYFNRFEINETEYVENLPAMALPKEKEERDRYALKANL